MENILLISATLLFFAFLIGLVKPSVIIRNGKVSRGKIFLFVWLPSFVLFAITGVIGNRKTAEALEKSDGVEELRLINPMGIVCDSIKLIFLIKPTPTPTKEGNLILQTSKFIIYKTRRVNSSKGYKEIPVFLKDFKDLKSLSLRNNDITTIGKTLLSMSLLKELDLSNNPINFIPNWITELTHLKKIDLDKTNIDLILQILLSSGVNILYISNPLNAKLNEQKAIDEKEDSGDESLGDFVIRKLLGNEHGYKNSFTKGDLYYIKPITDIQADSLGAFLIEDGFLNDDKNVSMQITFNPKLEKPAYELRAITDKEIGEDIQNVFKL
ncbi:MAG: hypothetical protein ACJA2S_004887 [Cyclobacteriaceae bacterium]|jgi:hypothetical protein